MYHTSGKEIHGILFWKLNNPIGTVAKMARKAQTLPQWKVKSEAKNQEATMVR